MIGGLPLGAWVLLLLAVGSGLTLELAFYRARLRERRSDGGGEREMETPAGRESRGGPEGPEGAGSLEADP
jgi:hypothetical protein